MQTMKDMIRYGRKNNRRNKKMPGLVLTAGLLAAVLAGCGSSDSKSASTMAVTEEAYEMSAADSGFMVSNGAAEINDEYYAEDDLYMEETAVDEEGAESAEQITEEAVTERKLIKTVNISAETENFDSLMPELEDQVTALGGYIEEMSVYNRNNYYTSDPEVKYLRYAGMTVRIPKENLETFLSKVGDRSNIVSRSESVSDVTLQYVDLESHKKALMTEQGRLLELMEQAETVEDIISIESRLSEVRYQIESMESQLRTYDNKIDYSTVYLSVEEVDRYTPSEEIGTWERIRNGFMESLEGVGTGFCNFAIWFVIHIPYLVVWAVIIAVLVFILCKLRKHMAKRRAGKKQTRVNPYVQSQNAYIQQEAVKDNIPTEKNGMEQQPEAADKTEE